MEKVVVRCSMEDGQTKTFIKEFADGTTAVLGPLKWLAVWIKEEREKLENEQQNGTDEKHLSNHEKVINVIEAMKKAKEKSNMQEAIAREARKTIKTRAVLDRIATNLSKKVREMGKKLEMEKLAAFEARNEGKLYKDLKEAADKERSEIKEKFDNIKQHLIEKRRETKFHDG